MVLLNRIIYYLGLIDPSDEEYRNIHNDRETYINDFVLYNENLSDENDYLSEYGGGGGDADQEGYPYEEEHEEGEEVELSETKEEKSKKTYYNNVDIKQNKVKTVKKTNNYDSFDLLTKDYK